MGQISGERRWMRIAVVLALATGLWLPARGAAADDDSALKQRALSFNDVTGKGPALAEVLELTRDPAKGKKVLALAVRMAKEDEHAFAINAAYILATSAQVLQDVEAGQVFYRLYAEQAKKLQSGLQVSDAYLNLIGLLYDAKQYAASEKVCHELLDLPTNDDDRVYQAILMRAKRKARQRMSMALAKEGKTDEASKIVTALIKEQPEDWLLLELKGWLQNETGRTQEAAKTYESMLERIRNDKSLDDEEKTSFVAGVRYILSGIYTDLNQIDKAAEQLKTLLSLRPDNPTYNNDLGYIWADHDMNLEESEKLIRKALEEERKQRKKADLEGNVNEDRANAAYLDSLGWVLFKQKKYAEAKKYLLQAVETKEGQHVEIFDHLGDVYTALGDKAKAAEAWKKAVEASTDSKREQQRKAEVEKKLKANE